MFDLIDGIVDFFVAVYRADGSASARRITVVVGVIVVIALVCVGWRWGWM